MQLIKNPSNEELGKWGTLAYVSEKERNRILQLPFGETKPAIKQVEKAIKEMKKKAAKAPPPPINMSGGIKI